MKKSPNTTTWVHPETRKPLGRFGQFLGRVGLGPVVELFTGAEPETERLRQQRARYEATEGLQAQRDRAHERARVASSALYAGMNVLGRTVDVPAHYRPGARTDRMQSPDRAGVVESSLPFGSEVTVPRRIGPVMVDGVIGKQPMPEQPVHMTPEDAAKPFHWFGPGGQPASPMSAESTPFTPAGVPTPANASPVNWLGGHR